MKRGAAKRRETRVMKAGRARSISRADKARALALTPVSRETLRRGSISSSSCCCSGSKDQPRRAVDASSDLDPAHRRFAPAPAAGAGRQDLGRPRIGRRLSRHPDRLCACRISRARWSISLKAMAKRPPSCAKRSRVTGVAGAGASANGSRNLGKACRTRRCGHRARPGAVENPVRSGVSFDRAGRHWPIPEGTRCRG